MGTRVYLACTQYEPLVEGHCLIVPIQHHLSMLEGDDDVWDEVRVRLIACSLKLPRTDDSLTELYEESDAYVCRAGQGCTVLRDSAVS